MMIKRKTFSTPLKKEIPALNSTEKQMLIELKAGNLYNSTLNK